MDELKLSFPTAHTAEFRCGETTLAHYDVMRVVPVRECPKPSLHPVRTLAGVMVTDFQPADHSWHHGIAWAFAYIDGNTFWGGQTFVRELHDYAWRDNHGSQRHGGWIQTGPASLRKQVDWVARNGEILLHETRELAARRVGPQGWGMRFSSSFLDVTGRSLRISSPVGEGRPEGGYGGLMWRGAEAWRDGVVTVAGRPVATAMGLRVPAFTYAQNPRRGAARLVFTDHPENPGYPNAWFERHGDQPLACFAVAHQEDLHLAAGATLALRCAMELWD